MDHEAVLSFEYDDDQRARYVAASVRPEIGDIAGGRTSATLTREHNCVEVRIEATDLVGLRAGINTWTTLLSVAERASGALE